MSENEKPKPWYLRMPVYLAGLVASAAVGALMKAHFERAEPDVNVTSVRVQTPTGEQLLAEGVNEQLRENQVQGSIPTVSPRLLELTDDHTWIPTVPSSASRTEYLMYLVTTKETLEGNLRQPVEF